MSGTLLNMAVAPGGVISLQGELGFATVEGALSLSREIFSEQGGDVTIDLAGIGRGDSAGLALLLHWVRELRASGRHIFYRAPPPHLLRLIQASALQDILPLTITTQSGIGS